MKTFIIDDDYISIYLTKHALREAGTPGDIFSFLSAQEALTTILQAKPENIPDIIFLDLNMPGMSGWQFLEALAPYKNRLLDKCQIHILTSSLDLADMARSEEFEIVSGFIHKTIDQANIKAIIAQIEEQAGLEKFTAG
ncbi:response regulator [Adhaeribacter aerolatus]|uniref:Response regulator n=1 Tax=Adhaeribacter aerolatus TaxID=670289 RepID=A0A512AXB8_9BACT|nr:response regulator [Adhaeribacter aerolatus]GEO04334.1 response regulator [Adhaeribacter aerolatus]